ncbi:hypothetical protein LCGC14_1550980 [marine sediment metagenome]|uniref:Uncharacterized protein n=1 Tax=marine sediment metagenome TaxID=412755 RepID=A0A0F9JBA4_9ZZZZ
MKDATHLISDKEGYALIAGLMPVFRTLDEENADRSIFDLGDDSGPLVTVMVARGEDAKRLWALNATLEIEERVNEL